MEHCQAPPGWGNDPLSKFLQDTTENIYATFHNLKQLYNPLQHIHQVFTKVAENMNRTPHLLAFFFLFRSHSAYLAGVRLALSGQIPEAYMVLRGSLECALYGLYVARKPSVGEVWLRRDEDDEAKKKVKQEFKVSNLFEVLGVEDRKLANIARKFYEITIDYGGHPNQQAFTSVMKTESDESKITFKVPHIIGNEPALHLCLKPRFRFN
ncbi:MAG: hypothetical protein WHX93_18440 [bacterium]